MRIALKALSGYVTAEIGTPDVPLTANRSEIHEWEIFDEVSVPGGVALTTSAGLFVSAEPDGSVHGNRVAPGLWETFIKQKLSDGSVAYRTWRQTYLTAEVGSAPICPVTNRSTTADAWQRFQVVPVEAPTHPPEPPEPPTPVEGLPALRSDFLTAQNAAGQYLNSGEYPALSEAKRAEIRGVWQANGYTVLMMETDWPGDSHVPPFSWTKNPAKFVAAARELAAVGIQSVPLIGLEGTGRTLTAQYVSEAASFARAAKAAGCTLGIIGLEAEEWSDDYGLYRALVRECGKSLTLLCHFHGGVLAHPLGPADPKAFYTDNPALNGICYQFDKQAHAGRFLVPDDNLIAQLASATRRLPAGCELHAGEYANLVSQAKAQHAGDVCGSLGYNTWNGIGQTPQPAAVDPFVPMADAIPISQISFSNMHGDCTAIIRSWPVTATLQAVKVTGQTIHFPNTASGRWTLVNGGILGNIWEIAETSPGRYKAQTWDYLASFDDTKEWLGSGFPGGGARWQLITGPARDKFDGCRERTNIVRVT